MFFEILSILGQTIWGLLSALFSVIWNNLPEILEIKKVLGYFTPAGAVAIYLGVPTIVVTIAVKLVENKGEIVSLSQMSTNILSSLASLSR